MTGRHLFAAIVVAIGVSGQLVPAHPLTGVAAAAPATAAEKAAAGSATRFPQWTIAGSPDEIRAHIQSLIDAGITYCIIYLPRVAYDLDVLHQFSDEIIPTFS